MIEEEELEGVPEPDDVPDPPAPERLARWSSLGLAGLGALLVALGLVPLALMTGPGLVATAPERALAAGLVLVGALAGAGLAVAGLLLHRVAKARVRADLTYEGLVEETSQEFDKVYARLEFLSATLATVESRIARTTDRVERLRRGGETERVTGGSAEPVAVNVMASPRDPPR